MKKLRKLVMESNGVMAKKPRVMEALSEVVEFKSEGGQADKQP